MRAFLVLVIVAAANAANLLRVQDSIPGQYIVKIKSDFDVESVLPTVRLAGGNIRRIFKSALRGFSAELSDEVLNVVLNLPAVEYVEENAIARPQTVPSWGLDRIDQRDLPLDDTFQPHLATGTALVHMYVIDTGIQENHDEFTNRLHIENPLQLTNPSDCNGHGTYCAGIASGTNYGVAPEAHLCSVKVTDCTGYATIDNIIVALGWIVDHAEKPAFAMMSLVSGKSDSLDTAVSTLVSNGVQTAVPAGNYNADACYYSPAGVTGVVTVGATDSSDVRTSTSNYGSCVDIFAPGDQITSAWYDPDSTSATQTMSGTSSACAHVTGALALYAVAEDQQEGDDGLNTVSELLSAASVDKVTDPGTGSNNRLLYV
ncbi:aqualysin-1-like [Lytechinus variegatus]|uniref:aqualysin-1-like n=1 Tax=Lytechinus variegatus TaxID=7654 RepID=UPI001BB14E62|nr:aqualysin-1-like [Lytechinus variegatus]